MQKEKEQTKLQQAPEPCSPATGNGQCPQDLYRAERQPEALAAQARHWSHQKSAAVAEAARVWGTESKP